MFVGKLFEGDKILGMGGQKVRAIGELLPLVQDLEDDQRYMEVDRVIEPNMYSDEIQLDERTGIEKVRAPIGSLGLKLDRNHKVLEVLPNSPLLHKVYRDDQVVSLNDTDVTELRSKDFVNMLVELADKKRVLGIKRAPHSPRQVIVPPVSSVGLVLRDNHIEGCVDCIELLEDCPLQGKVFPGDRVRGANCRPVTSIQELMPYMKDERFRVLTVETLDPELSDRKPVAVDKKSKNGYVSTATSKKAPPVVEATRKEEALKRYRSSPLKHSPLEETADIATYKTVGQEKFMSIIAPPGKLGIKLNKNHEVMDLLSTSPLAGKVHLNDRVITIDEVDVRGKDPASLIVLLMASQSRTRVLGIRRKTGKTVRVVCEPGKRSLNDISEAEMKERFPNLSHFGVPMGNVAADTSTRCRVLSELLSFHESIGLANDIETENGSFCHLVKIPKKGLSKRWEFMNSLDDVMSSLASICGDDNDAAELLLEFLANKSPSSYIKYTPIAESRPAKKRKIEESKRDPELAASPRPSRNGDVTDSLARTQSESPANLNTSTASTELQGQSSTTNLTDSCESKEPQGQSSTTNLTDSCESKEPQGRSSTINLTASCENKEVRGNSSTTDPAAGGENGEPQVDASAEDQVTEVDLWLLNV
jgi:hypothetical protein